MDKPTRHITKDEMLLAVAMSQFHKTTHVLFIPPSTHYVDMLSILKNKKLIEPISESYYKLTDKAWHYLLKKDEAYFETIDKEIDTFINNL
jgi:hypothetical protein